MPRRWFVVPAFAALLVSTIPIPDDVDAARGTATRSVVWAEHGMVAASQPLAVQVGLEILKRGGSAADAAIAVNACLGVMEPTANGVGGDLFAIIWDPKQKKVVGLNASGRAPMNLTPDKVPPDSNGTIPLHSPYAWTVPGCVDGWFELHRRYGKLLFSDILQPAAGYADEGFPVSPVIASDWARGAERFKDKPGFREVFMPGGRAPKEGERFKNPALARTLRFIASRGRNAFYRGPITDQLVGYSRTHDGFFTKQDFDQHQSTWVEPISTNYRGWTVWELPPNGQGLTALEMLNILENFDLKAMGRESPDFWHVMTEAKKLAFADRARYFADPAFAQTPVEKLLGKSYGKKLSQKIKMDRAALVDEATDVSLNRKETTYLCVADSSGLMVSLIQSNYTGFGSGYVVPALGFGIQNRGSQFSLKAGHPNVLAPGKRPFHTIIPAFVTRDSTPLMAFGLMGGDMQPQGHVQVIVNLLDFGMNLQEAGDAIRFHHTGSSEPTGTVMKDGGILHIEDGLPAATLEELRRRGHRIESEAVGQYGGYQAIWRDPETGIYAGATEKRKDGCALGF